MVNYMANYMLKNLVIILAIGAIVMISFSGCSPDFKYGRYLPKDSRLDFTMEYLSGWLAFEQFGSHNSFAQVVFVYPKGKDKAFKASMVATLKDESKVQINTATIEAFADDLIAKRLNLKDSRLIYRKDATVAGEDAVEIEMAYKALDNIDRVNAKLIPVKERIVILKRAGKFYIFRYENKAKEFEGLNKAFNHIITSLNFK